MKALVGAFNQEKALVGAFSVIVQRVVEPMEHYTALILNIPTVPRRPLHLQLDGRARLLRQALQQRRGAPGPPQDPHQPLHLGPGGAGGGGGGGGGILRPAHPVADAGRGGQPAAAQRPLAAGGALIETNRRVIESLFC